MRHGPAAEASSAEPNLTPLLDVVLQLLMFFMMCVNFVNEQVKEDVQLPESASARPMDKAQTDVLFLNLKPFHFNEWKDRVRDSDLLRQLQDKFREGDPLVFVSGKDPMKPIELDFWLKQKHEDLLKESEGKEVKTAVIIRADADTEYTQVFRVLQMCKVRGFTNLKLRAKTPAGSGA
jgi:biopolymer transport protein ExbD